jgi:hypothetical protein
MSNPFVQWPNRHPPAFPQGCVHGDDNIGSVVGGAAMSRKQPKCADLWSPWEFKRRSKRSGERPRSARDCVSACNFGSDAILMTGRFMLRR